MSDPTNPTNPTDPVAPNLVAGRTTPSASMLDVQEASGATPEAALLAAPLDDGAPARSLWSDAWEIMRRSPLFWIASTLIVILLTMTVFPGLFTGKDPSRCVLDLARQGPSGDAIFGYDIQGCDVYAQTIYGARASILVGVSTTLLVTLVGVALGTLGGYVGGWLDALLSRIADMVFAIPLLLGAIVAMTTVFRTLPGAPYFVVVGKVVVVLALLSWPSIYRLMRSSVLQVKPAEYVLAARALGSKTLRLVLNHVIPNAIAPVIVVATIDLGAYIATEATLSFLGIGLQPPAISWGIAISDASSLGYVRTAPHMLLFPSLFLSVTVLSFIMLGEVVREAIDPKLR